MQRGIMALALVVAGTGTAAADATSGLYLGVGAGQFNIEIQDIDLGQDFDSDDTALRVFGGWRFNPNFALELAYADLGTPNDTISGVDVNVELTGFAPYVVLTAPIGLLELYTKLGYFFYDIEVTGSLGGISASDSMSDEDFVYAVGLGAVLMDHLNLRFEYEVIDVSDADDATAYWLSGAWRF